MFRCCSIRLGIRPTADRKGNSMQVVDAHHHIWIPEQSEPDLGYGWLRDIGSIKPFGDPTAIQRDYQWDEYINESSRHDIAASVFVQCDGAIADPVAETAWVQSTISKPAEKFGIVGLVNLATEQAQAQLEAQCQFASFKGVRQIISYLDEHPQLCFSSEHLLRNARWKDQFALLADHGLSFDLQLYPEQMIEAAEFLSQFSNVPIIIDHAGSPYDQSEAGFKRWESGLEVLGQLDNVSIKLSGFGMFDKHWSSTSINPLVTRIIDIFGFDRVMYGSNFPVDKLFAEFDETLERISCCIAPFGKDAVQSVFSQTARRIYQLK